MLALPHFESTHVESTSMLENLVVEFTPSMLVQPNYCTTFKTTS
jgi:hypothetical protein